MHGRLLSYRLTGKIRRQKYSASIVRAWGSIVYGHFVPGTVYLARRLHGRGENGQEDGMAAVNPIQVQKYLSGINYPADKKTIVETAQKEGADGEVVDALQRMPGDHFNSPNDVSEAIGKLS
jgi:hypothetical protein